MTDPTPPPIAAEIAARLTAAGWTVRRLRDEGGFGGESAEKLLGKRPGAPSLESADRALALLGRQLWHRRKPKKG